jgi:ATP-dependent Lon protease
MSEVNINQMISIPVLPLRDVVLFPGMVIPLFVGRALSIKAIDAAMDQDKSILMVMQKSPEIEEPQADDLCNMGCLASILQILKLPDGTVKVLVEGMRRAKVNTYIEATESTCIQADIEVFDRAESVDQKDEQALIRIVINQLEQYSKLNKKIPADFLQSADLNTAEQISDLIASQIPIKLTDKQAALEIIDANARLEYIISLIESEIDILQVEKRIRNRVKRQMEKSQRDYYLNEQVKAIQKELGEGEDGADLEEFEKKIKTARLPAEAKKKAESELKKLRLMSPLSAEAGVVRGYLEVMLDLPWRRKSKINQDLTNAQKILDEDHYGLEKVKERIVEYLAVQQRVDKMKAPILCLVGPPGVGKTSLGQSIAKAINRKFIRMALGGVGDEAEIRGHRRTYIGSMPGKILQNMAKVEVRNPLFLLDEIDKMGRDLRGDPASALLEVLDPEQNHTFQDHYLEVDFDLSDVMFVATSNSYNIAPALLDRMEIIRLSGYTEDEKLNIATKYLLIKQLKNNGLKDDELSIEESAVIDIIRYYTREAGVRSLEREISKICRKGVTQILLKKNKDKKIVVGSHNLGEYLGIRKYDFGVAAKENQVGQVTGLAWTEVGGELLTIEASVMSGKGQIIRTGSLGDVMKESIDAARSVVRARADQLNISKTLFEKQDIHLHVPEGATPKDGPSAGIAMTTAIVSVLTNTPIYADIAMTGEITLRGEVLAIGGLKEKLLAALRGDIKRVLIPKDNVKDLEEIPQNVKDGLEIIPVKWIDEVLSFALVDKKAAEKQAQKAAEKPTETTDTKLTTSLQSASKSSKKTTKTKQNAIKH